MKNSKNEKVSLVLLGNSIGEATIDKTNFLSMRRLSFGGNRKLIKNVALLLKDGYEVELHHENGNVQYTRYYNTKGKNIFYSRTTPQSINNFVK